MCVERKLKGSNLIEYVLPLSVIGLIVGTGLYYMFADNSLMNFFAKSSGQTYSADNTNLSMGFLSGEGGSGKGIYEKDDGKVYITNKYGQTIAIPRNFYDKYKDEIERFLKKGKFDYKPLGIIGEETSGGVGIETIAEGQNASLRLYGTLLRIAAKYTDDVEAKNKLKSLAKYGTKLGTREKKLQRIKNTLDLYKKNHELFKNNYITARDNYTQALDLYRNGNPNNLTRKDLTNLYNKITKSYTKYSNLEIKFENQSKDLSKIAQDVFVDLKEETGMSFDRIVESLAADPNIDTDTKDMVLPIGNRIKELKDSVDILASTVSTYNTSFENKLEQFTEEMGQLDTIDIIMEEGAGDETLALSGSLPGEEANACYDNNLNYICEDQNIEDEELLESVETE